MCVNSQHLRVHIHFPRGEGQVHFSSARKIYLRPELYEWLMRCTNVDKAFSACIRQLSKKYGNGVLLLQSKIHALMQEIRQNKNSPQPNRITFWQGEGKGRNERKFARFLHEKRPRVMQPRKCLQGKSGEQREAYEGSKTTGNFSVGLTCNCSSPRRSPFEV